MTPPFDIPGVNYRIADVYLDYDGPQLFSLVDEIGAHFLAVHTVHSDTDNWLLAPISRKRLRAFETGRTALRRCFKDPELGVLELVCVDHNGIATVKRVSPDSLPDEYFPQPDSESVFLPVAPREVIIAPAEVPATLRQAEPMWETSPEALDYFRAIRTPVTIAAQRTRRFVADLVLEPGSGRTDVPAQALGAFLTISQKLLDTLGLPDGAAPTRNPLLGREWTQLDAVASFPSSFGLRLETHKGDLAGNSEARKAFDALFGLLEAKDNQGALAQRLRTIPKRAIAHYRAFAKALSRAEADFELTAGYPDDQYVRRASLTRRQIVQIGKYLDRNSDILDETVPFTGRLVAASIPTKFFRLENEEQAVSGRIADSCMPAIKGKTLNDPYDALLKATTEVNEVSGEEVLKYTLIEISPLSDRV